MIENLALGFVTVPLSNTPSFDVSVVQDTELTQGRSWDSQQEETFTSFQGIVPRSRQQRTNNSQDQLVTDTVCWRSRCHRVITSVATQTRLR